MSPIAKPPYDPELAPFLAGLPGGDFTPEGIPALRKIQNDLATLEGTLAGEPYTHTEHTAPGPHGPVTLGVFHPTTGGGSSSSSSSSKDKSRRPGIYFIHSGGMICGNRFTFFKDALRWGQPSGAVCITVEYRQAPEHPFPAAVDDSWAGLIWVADHAAELGIDPSRILVAGQSAGGNLAAAMAILARDRKGPKLCGQLIDAGMLDDRMDRHAAMAQYVSEGTWTRGSNVTAWNAYLGGEKVTGSDSVSPLAAPSRATDLSNLPPALISVGSAEAFRDENVEYASKLWEAGTQAELHVWPGGYHCFDSMMPTAQVAKESTEAKIAWVKRIFSSQETKAKL
ncbi:Alpha/Beta hydrolase protein [Xylariales sp. PMI_506]|nr:Alpha/Beta hydrolase protein [Xylariales sp. PMI_506]